MGIFPLTNFATYFTKSCRQKWPKFYCAKKSMGNRTSRETTTDSDKTEADVKELIVNLKHLSISGINLFIFQWTLPINFCKEILQRANGNIGNGWTAYEFEFIKSKSAACFQLSKYDEVKSLIKLLQEIQSTQNDHNSCVLVRFWTSDIIFPYFSYCLCRSVIVCLKSESNYWKKHQKSQSVAVSRKHWNSTQHYR